MPRLLVSLGSHARFGLPLAKRPETRRRLLYLDRSERLGLGIDAGRANVEQLLADRLCRSAPTSPSRAAPLSTASMATSGDSCTVRPYTSGCSRWFSICW